MKTSIQLVSFIFILICATACGNKKASNDSGVKEADPVAAVPAVEEMILTIEQNDIYDGKPHVLTIKGGVTFPDETKPYQVEMKENNYNGHVDLGEFRKNPEGTVSIDVQPSINDYNIDGGKMVLEVTDANGTKKTVEFEVDYLP